MKIFSIFVSILMLANFGVSPLAVQGSDNIILELHDNKVPSRVLILHESGSYESHGPGEYVAFGVAKYFRNGDKISFQGSDGQFAVSASSISRSEGEVRVVRLSNGNTYLIHDTIFNPSNK